MPADIAQPTFTLHHPAVRCYDAEWRRLRRDREAIRRADHWQIVRTEIESLDDVLVAIGYNRPANPEAERNLRRLVCYARFDPLAAQVVVRRLLPGALSVAARNRRRFNDDTLSELLGSLWIAVRTFDLARSPGSLAAALLADAEYRAFRRGRRRRFTEVPRESVGDRPEAEPERDPRSEVDELIGAALALGIADADDVALLELLLVEPSATRLAARLNVTERTVRNRRARVTAKLRTAAVA